MIREDFLQQNAFVDEDSYSSYEKQGALLSLILEYGDLCKAALARGYSDVEEMFSIAARERIGRAKTAADFSAEYAGIAREMAAQIDKLAEGGSEK
jgi:V/A-type H+-transporting ATPase subunit A